jgi:hypothetical protein
VKGRSQNFDCKRPAPATERNGTYNGTEHTSRCIASIDARCYVLKTRLDKTRRRYDKTRQDKNRQGKTRQGKASQGKARQDKARQGKTTQDNTRQQPTLLKCFCYPCATAGVFCHREGTHVRRDGASRASWRWSEGGGVHVSGERVTDNEADS